MACRDCQYWSEMLAQCLGGGPVQAMCLSPNGPLSGKYTSGTQDCPLYLGGRDELLAVDDPEREEEPDGAEPDEAKNVLTGTHECPDCGQRCFCSCAGCVGVACCHHMTAECEELCWANDEAFGGGPDEDYGDHE